MGIKVYRTERGKQTVLQYRVDLGLASSLLHIKNLPGSGRWFECLSFPLEWEEAFAHFDPSPSSCSSTKWIPEMHSLLHFVGSLFPSFSLRLIKRSNIWSRECNTLPKTRETERETIIWRVEQSPKGENDSQQHLQLTRSFSCTCCYSVKNLYPEDCSFFFPLVDQPILYWKFFLLRNERDFKTKWSLSFPSLSSQSLALQTYHHHLSLYVSFPLEITQKAGETFIRGNKAHLKVVQIVHCARITRYVENWPNLVSVLSFCSVIHILYPLKPCSGSDKNWYQDAMNTLHIESSVWST